MHSLSKQQCTAQGFCHSSLLLTPGDLCGTFLVVKPEVAATLMQFSDLHSEEEQWGIHCSRKACTREGLIPAGLCARLLVGLYTTFCGHSADQEHWN